ncbi:aspartate 1-decarboxylase [bacterium]|nr:aspartate 1-decarboxylase [bacterium]
MTRTFLNSKIHSAVVTEARADYEGSIGIDSLLLELTGILPGEKVDVYDITNGERLSTYVIPEEKGSGKIKILGAAARKINPGDKIIIASYVQLTEEEWQQHRPRVICVDGNNHPK